MRLATGVHLGPYEVLAPIAAGGMGEVYRAIDSKLGREVALKILPSEIGRQPDALPRFEREARAVAALSHPNILAIFDFGSADGVSYAVMELLDGETLRQALAEGPVTLRRALDYSAQIARGLAAAHDKGIVHRDIKPENIFITRDDRVKILDFGLARQELRAQAGISLAPTQNSPTEPGMVLGTIGYMAPEQVRGETADTSADIFALGAVLYEMVTGRRAFHRDTAAETMTAILREDPTEWPANIPRAVERLIRRCLEKKAAARFHSAHDLAFALEAVAGTPSSASIPGASVATPSRFRGRTVLAIAAVAVALALAAIGGVSYGRRTDVSEASNASSQVPRFRQLSFEDAVIEFARFGPDGRTVVYSATKDDGDARLLLARLEFPGTTPLSIPTGLIFSVSKNAEMLVGLNPRKRAGSSWGEATLARLPLLGGAPRPVLENVKFADWSPADESMMVVRVAGSQERLEFPIGTVLYETEGEIGFARVSPDANHVAFLEWPVKADDRGTVAIVDRKGTRQMTSRTWEGVRSLAWTPDGREVWFSAAVTGSQYDIWAAGIDKPERRIYGAPAGLLLYDIANDGKLLVSRYDRSIYVEGFFDGEKNARDLSWLGGSFAQDLSRDGKRTLMSHFGEGSSSNYDVYVRGSRDAEITRIGEGQAQQFSPDGTTALAVIHGPPSRLVIHPVGPGETKTVATGNVVVTEARWFPDGKRLFIMGAEPSKGRRAYVTDVSGSTPLVISPEGISFLSARVALSQDGRRVAFRSPQGAVMLYPTDRGEPTEVKGLAADEMPFDWTQDDRRLLLLTNARPRQLVAVEPSIGRREILKEIAPPNPTLIGPSSIYLTADGRSYVANFQRRAMTLFLAEGLK
jgi:eukaryotic-like serine/threonine-protein kinase